MGGKNVCAAAVLTFMLFAGAPVLAAGGQASARACYPNTACSFAALKVTSICVPLSGGAYSMKFGSTLGNRLDWTTYVGSTCSGAVAQTPLTYAVVSGQWTFTTALAGPDGTAAAPAFTFSDDLNTGFYRIGVDRLGVATAGVRSFNFSATAGVLEGTTSGSSLSLNTGVGARLTYGGTTITADSSTIVLQTSGAITGTSGLQTGSAGAGTAFASFPAAAAGNESRILYDSTNDVLRHSVASAWVGPPVSWLTQVTAYFPGLTALLNVSTMQWKTTSQGNAHYIQTGVSSGTTLVAGVGAGDATFTIYDVTLGAATGATCVIPCAAAAGTVTLCAGGNVAIPTSEVLELRLTTNGCGTLPQVNFAIAQLDLGWFN